jgi:hypothetical protein
MLLFKVLPLRCVNDEAISKEMSYFSKKPENLKVTVTELLMEYGPKTKKAKKTKKLYLLLRNYPGSSINRARVSCVFGPKGKPQASNLFSVIRYLQEQEGIHLEVKARKIAQGAVWQRLISYFSGQLAGFFEHGIFMVLPPTPTSKPLILNRENGSFIIEWE